MFKFLILIFATAVLVNGSAVTPKYVIGALPSPPWLKVTADDHSGFVVDLAHELSEQMNFDYEIVLPEDRKYGHLDQSTGKWTGLIGKVMSGEIDFAITDMTITPEREEIVDFTTPILEGGVGILFSSKTRQALPFNNLEELVAQSDVDYGVLDGGSTMSDFMKSSNPTYKKMAEYWTSHPENLVKSYAEGIDRVVENDRKYAFFMENHWFGTVKEHYPSVMLVGDIILPRKYGIPVKKGSPLLPILNEGIKHLKDNGTLKKLLEKYHIVN